MKSFKFRGGDFPTKGPEKTLATSNELLAVLHYTIVIMVHA